MLKYSRVGWLKYSCSLFLFSGNAGTKLSRTARSLSQPATLLMSWLCSGRSVTCWTASCLRSGPFVFHRRQGKDSVVISQVFIRSLFLRYKIVEQVRSDPDDLCLANAVVNEFVIKAFGDEFQHLISLLLAGNFFVALLVHPCRWLHYCNFVPEIWTVPQFIQR